MRVLVLGGTEFVGAAVVDEALARGDEVTVLNRGSHPAGAGVTAVIGDRTAGFPDLDGEWDLVVDTWSWAPIAVRDAARALRGRVGRYVYVSSRSVYAHPTPKGAAEDAALVDGAADDASFDDYARAKRGGELAALETFGDDAVLLRAGLILGPRENIGRLPWWLQRAARGGDLLAPGPADAPIQYVDARDLAAFALTGGLSGAYNVVSPVGHTTMGGFLEEILRATGSTATLRWGDPQAILDAGIAPWMELPVWIPPGDLHDTMHTAEVSKALTGGLRIRPLSETIGDTWAWLQEVGEAPQRADRPRLGLDPATEAAFLNTLGL